MAFWRFTGTAPTAYASLGLTAQPGFVYDFRPDFLPPDSSWSADPGPATPLLQSATTPATMPRFRKAVAKVRNGAADAKLLCVGDSTTSGVGSTGSTLTAHSYPSQLASLLNSYFAPAAIGLGVGPTGLGSNPDGRWVLGTGWTYGQFGFGGGSCVYCSASPAGSAVFTPGVLADRYDVYYYYVASAGTVTFTATGGSATPVSFNGAGTAVVQKVTLSAGSASASNTITMTEAGPGTAYILGIEPWLSTKNQIRVANAGVGGSSTNSWTTVPATNLDGVAAIKAYAPDLTVISLGINDATNSVSQATYQANLSKIVSAAALTGDVILMSMPPSAANAPYVTYEPQYIAVKEALASQYSGAYLDLTARFESFSAANTLGLMSDSYHPNDLGYWDIAQGLFKLITNI